MSANLISFDSEKAARYLQSAFAQFYADPADSDFQRGYLAAMLAVYREALGKGAGNDFLALLDRQVSA